MTAASSTHQHGAASLRDLLEARASAKEIEAFLDALAPTARVEEVLRVTGVGDKRLYDAVADAPTLTLEELIPQGVKGTVIYQGRNSLPLFSRFQKRVARVSGGSVVVGYNHQTMAAFTGPGYFIVKPASGEGEHGKELLFDYTEAPPAQPDGWPRYSPNDRGLSKAVYGNMKDYVRRVARGVVVGKAYKLGVDQKAYFSLSLGE